jgi:uncharacterized protein YcfJ
MMKTRIAAPFLMLSALAAPVIAADFADSAPVVSSLPVYQTVTEPQQQCWTESVAGYEQRRSPGGVILGGISGGLIGNTIGRGNGRAASTVVGAMIGAVVGDQIANRNGEIVAVNRPVQRCQLVQGYRQVLSGYQVTYYYNARNSTVVLPYDAGPRVPIEVGVSGAAYRSAYVGLPLQRISYAPLHVPIWEERPYRRRHHHDDDRGWHR